MHGHGEGLALFAAQCGADWAAQLASFLEPASTREELLLPPEADKGARRATHELVRSHFPCLISDVVAAAGGVPPGVRLRRQPALKAVALDLDGTLWPGVLLEGVAPPEAWAAGGFTTLGALLARLQAAGVLLFSCSRNDEAPVMAAWPPEEVCPLQPRHFTAHAFGWGAKSARLETLARAVELAHTQLLFIDDTAAEREEVAAALPRVRVMGGDMQLVASVVAWEVQRCEAVGVTADAASRTEKARALLARAAAAAAFGKAEAAGARRAGGDLARRRAAREKGARLRVSGTGGGYATVGGFPEPFLRTLELRLTLRRHDASEAGAAPPALQSPAQLTSGLARAAELAARSTQFNTTVALPFHKWGAPQAARLAQLEQLVLHGAGEVWSMAAVDRFGEHGMVAVAALDGSSRSVVLVAVSCRVLALECAPVFAAEVLRRSPCLAGTAPVHASLAITERNAPCRTLFQRLGFTREAQDDEQGGQQWTLHGGTAELPQTDASIYCVTEAELAPQTQA